VAGKVKKFFSWAFWLPVSVALILFALANRAMVAVSFDPITPADPWLSIAMPLWGVLFAGIFLGLVTGWVWSWWNQGKWRKQARSAQAELQAEKRELDRLRNANQAGKGGDIVPAG